MALEKYKAKRNFAVTSEPSGKPLPKKVRGASRFVIQKHDASRLHYDFRLEMDGVLKSWAVPKGLPWGQGEKHLAVEVEDHPIEYENFEGIIPKGNYGGGTVMVWDRGTYYVYGEDPLGALKKGRLHLVLDGEKAKGEWALIRIRSDSEKNQWLLLKATKSIKPISKKKDDQSVISGRTMKQIAEDCDAEWESDRDEPTTKSAVSDFKSHIRATLKKKESRKEEKIGSDGEEFVGRAHRLPKAKSGSRGGRPTTEFDGQLGKLSVPDELPSAKPRFIEPMKARLSEKPPTAGDWIYELKFDGFRLLAIREGKSVELKSRNKNDLSARFSDLLDPLRALPAREFVLDGEAVALDDEGRSSFQCLQAREMEAVKRPIYLYLFDILQLNGKDLTSLPLHARKAILQKLCADAGDPLRFSGELGSEPEKLLAEVKRLGLEGIIGKLRDSVYEPGRRSGAWLKIKSVNEQEFVIGGYTPPQGARQYFGALLVGYYEKKKLLFAGKVGTGFDTKMLAMLYKRFKKEERDNCPFADLPSKQGGQWVQGITPGMMRKMHWLNPVLVAQIKFGEWTRDLKLRQPVFLGLREDKKPSDVVREA
jgi:bifunctional non-homologous end joining protein LigD